MQNLVLSLHYYGSKKFLFVNATKTYHFKAKDSELKLYSLYLGNISKDFTINNIKKGRLNGVAKVFSVDYNVIDTKGILDIHRYLMKETCYKIMFRIINKMFVGLLSACIIGGFGTSLV